MSEISLVFRLEYQYIIIIIIIIIIIFTPREFFTPAFAAGLSQESEWQQQVSSGLRDSSGYSSQS